MNKLTLNESLTLHILMQLHLPHNDAISFKQLAASTGLPSEELATVLRSPLFDQVWDPVGGDNGCGACAYMPSPEAFDAVAILFYQNITFSQAELQGGTLALRNIPSPFAIDYTRESSNIIDMRAVRVRLREVEVPLHTNVPLPNIAHS